MRRRLQLGMRENPASDPRHGSREAVGNITSEYAISDGELGPASISAGHNHPLAKVNGSSHAASPRAATGGERIGDQEGRPAAVAAFAHSPHSPTLTPDFEPLIASSQAARLLGNIHVKTLQRYARRGELPGYQIAGHWYFRASELDGWLRSRLNSNCQPADRVDLVPKELP
jgi:excisionase family DNA binding protein